MESEVYVLKIVWEKSLKIELMIKVIEYILMKK